MNHDLQHALLQFAIIHDCFLKETKFIAKCLWNINSKMSKNIMHVVFLPVYLYLVSGSNNSWLSTGCLLLVCAQPAPTYETKAQTEEVMNWKHIPILKM